ncbi:ABC transporter permease [Deinococcus lacus]|uniref:ABC transporter permease n=1 Tax=Deinococcus lacus TaxID=392561 RepID=A0ABW1YDQ3_9DEIO
MSKVLLILELSLREALRKRLVIVLLTLTAAFVGFYLYGVYKSELTLADRASGLGFGQRSEMGSSVVAINVITIFGLYLVYFLGSLMAVLSTVAAVSGDIENGVMQSIISRPVSRAELVLGRWLGFTVVNVGYVVLVSAVMLLGIWLITGFVPPNPLPAVGLMALAVALLTAATVLGSTMFTTLANGIGVFVLYGFGASGGILDLVGRSFDIPTMVTLGRLANVLMPTNALWLGASDQLQGQAMRDLFGLVLARVPNPLFGSEPIAPGMLVWAAALTVLSVLGAMWKFSRRDL